MSETYPAGGPPPAPSIASRRIGKIRSPIGVWLLSLITLGIYYLVWYYKINREVAEFDPSIDVSPGGAVVAITIGGLIIVPPFVSTFNTGGRIARAQESAGMPGDCSRGIGLLLWIVGGFNAIYYQAELNRIWRRY